jgi:hypothetical protein
MGTRRIKVSTLAPALAAALLLGGCGGGAPGVSLEPQLVWTAIDTERVSVDLADGVATFQFAPVRLGERAAGLLQVENIGSAPATVGYPASLAEPFSIDVPGQGLVIGVGEKRNIGWTFAPTEEGDFSWEGALEVLEDPKQSQRVRLAARGEAPAFTCDADRLDFGRLVRGTSKELAVHCRNDAAVAGKLHVNPIDGPAVFSHRFGKRGGTVEVEPGKTETIVVEYTAAVDGRSTGRLLLESEVNGVRERVVRVLLEGVALERVISCGPTFLDFGFVAPGTTARKEVLCRNAGSDPFRIESAELDRSSDGAFTWDVEFPEEIPAAVGDTPGELVIGVIFGPDRDDESRRLNGILVLATNDPGTPRVDIVLTGFAGGPVLSCSPSALDFGVVAKGMPRERSFVCTNVGTDDPGTAEDLLVIERVESTNPGEFVAEVEGGLDPNGYPVGGTFTVKVTYAPANDGTDNAAIVLHSNAVNVTAAEPYAVPVTGRGRDLPACDFTLVPEEVRFGIIDKNRVAVREFAVVNHLQDAECLIQELHLEACHPSFSLPGGDVEQTMVPPGSEVRFQVQFAPTEYASQPYTCEIHFDISNPDDAHQVIPVSGSSQELCALIAPTDLDFGGVEPPCATNDREFQIINMCPPPLVIQDVEIAASASDEFFLRSFPPAGTTITQGNNAIFTVAYRPRDLGVDLGAVHVWVEGSSEPYAASLRGEGRMGATHRDTFVQNDRPKVDVLWVIDNSGSMGWVHDELADNLGPFLSFADANRIDYNIAVTTTGLAPGGSGCLGGVQGGENGRFFPVDNSRPRILRPDTPDLEQNWRLNVTVGTCGGTGQHEEQVFEAAYRALSTPLVDHCDDPRPTSPEPNDGNCGFLRPDAHLSIIGVTDEAEHSPQTVNFYYNAYMSIKGYKNRHLFNFHGIAGDEFIGCSNAEPCDRVAEMVRKTEGGVFQSICAPNWEEALRKMSAKAFGFKTCFKLSGEPADKNANGHISDTEGEIFVKMNGRDLSSRGAQNQVIWSYDGRDNSLCFEPLTVPEPGAVLEVDYQVACFLWE